MPQVEDTAALLMMALRDLHDGESALAGRLASVRANAQDEGLAAIISEDSQGSLRQREHLASIARSLGQEPGGQSNIWLRAILDDADNDAETIAEGPLRDIALTGALRKAKQSGRVSYETAIGLAQALGLEEAATKLRAIRDEEQRVDEALAQVLARLCTALPREN